MRCSIVVIIDRSGSMQGKRLDAAKSDASSFINIMEDGDKLGVVAFSTDATTVFPGKKSSSVAPILPDGMREPITEAIEALTSSGSTHMVEAFTLAQGLLAGTNGRVGEVFLSDGEYTVVKKPGGGDPVPWLEQNQPKPPIPIHTIALGHGGQEKTLKGIADKTGGRYHFVEDANDLADIYDIIAGEMSVAGLIGTARSTVRSYKSDRKSATVPAGATEAIFAINWDDRAVAFTSEAPPPANHVQISLRDPKDQIIHALPIATGKGFAVFKIPNPVQGTYGVTVWYIGEGSLACTVGVFDNSSITAAIAAPQKPVPAGSPATVDFRLADGGDPIDDARVEVSLESPLITLAEAAEAHAERLKAVSVEDDVPEEHQTAAKLAALQRQTGEQLLPRELRPMTAQAMGGGLYRVEIPSLPKAGSHTVRVVAHGYSAKSKTPFQRTAAISFIASET